MRRSQGTGLAGGRAVRVLRRTVWGAMWQMSWAAGIRKRTWRLFKCSQGREGVNHDASRI